MIAFASGHGYHRDELYVLAAGEHPAWGYSGWGPPPGSAGPVIAIGFDPGRLDTLLGGCRTEARIENDAGVDNDEHGVPVVVCAGPRGAWGEVWPELRVLG